ENAGSGTLAITNTTLTGNQANGGGGLFNVGATTLVNATLAGNQANVGGGIENFSGGKLTLDDSTLSGNAAATSGGRLDNTATATVTNSIVAGNGGGEIAGSSPVTHAGLDVIGVGADSDGSDHVINAPSLNDLFADVGANPDTDVQSGLPANNGGVVETIALV